MTIIINARLILSSFIFVGLVLGLQACGGGGEGLTPKSRSSQSTAAGYYYQGTFTDKNSGVTNNLLGILSYNRFIYMNETAKVLYDATMDYSGSTFTANLIIYKNGETPISTATASGSFDENTSITIDVTGSGDNTIDGVVTFNFSPSNSSNSSVSKINNFFWGGVFPINNFTTSNNLTGSISAMSFEGGSILDNCVHDASLSKFTAIPDTNLYNVTIVVDTCTDAAAQGTYKGLASTYMGAVADDTMFFAVTNTKNNYSISSQYER